MSELYRLGIKLFASDPTAVRPRDFVPVFHSWIQRQCVAGHLLIDVHDYSHVFQGPGVLLVAHEGNFSTDLAGGRPGLIYWRKQPVSGDAEAQIRASLNAALQAAALVEDEAALKGVRLRRDEALVIFNDRLLAPNQTEAFDSLKPALLRVFGSKAALTQAAKSPKDRLAVQVAGVDL